PHADRARIGAGDDALRGDEAPAGARRRRCRRDAEAWPGEAPLPQSGPDPPDPRPVDRQVHGAPGLGARRPQERAGGVSMTTMTEINQVDLATQVYQVFIKASPEQIWEAITNPEFTTKYFYGAR